VGLIEKNIKSVERLTTLSEGEQPYQSKDVVEFEFHEKMR
jgi:hypothetical protein